MNYHIYTFFSVNHIMIDLCYKCQDQRRKKYNKTQVGVDKGPDTGAYLQGVNLAQLEGHGNQILWDIGKRKDRASSKRRSNNRPVSVDGGERPAEGK